MVPRNITARAPVGTRTADQISSTLIFDPPVNCVRLCCCSGNISTQRSWHRQNVIRWSSFGSHNWRTPLWWWNWPQAFTFDGIGEKSDRRGRANVRWRQRLRRRSARWRSNTSCSKSAKNKYNYRRALQQEERWVFSRGVDAGTTSRPPCLVFFKASVWLSPLKYIYIDQTICSSISQISQLPNVSKQRRKLFLLANVCLAPCTHTYDGFDVIILWLFFHFDVSVSKVTSCRRRRFSPLPRRSKLKETIITTPENMIWYVVVLNFLCLNDP